MHFARSRGADWSILVRTVGKQMFSDSPIASNVEIPQRTSGSPSEEISRALIGGNRGRL